MEPVAAFLQSLHIFAPLPPNPPPIEQKGEGLAVGNGWEHPRPGLGLGAQLWKPNLCVARETSVFPRKETTALWLLRHRLPPPKK